MSSELGEKTAVEGVLKEQKGSKSEGKLSRNGAERRQEESCWGVDKRAKKREKRRGSREKVLEKRE